MMLIPLLAIYEAAVIVDVLGFLGRRRGMVSAVFAVGAIGALAGVLIRFRPPVIETGWEFVAWVAAGIAIVAVSWLRWRFAAMLVLVGMMTLFPLRRFQTLFPTAQKDEQREQRRAMAFVYEHTGMSDTVFDGWKGICTRFGGMRGITFFLHREIRLMVPEGKWGELRRIGGGEHSADVGGDG